MSENQNTEAVVEAVAPRVSITQCQTFLKEGKTRKEIAEYYNLPMSVMAEKVWSHPALKGLKTKKIYNVELVDDRVLAEEAVVANDAVAAMVEVTAETIVPEPATLEEANTTTEANVAFSDLQGELNEVETEIADTPTAQDWN